MRTGGCTVQQALTPEAATVVKQAVTLARRRGHAQVTPLHVANTMLTTSTGLLRTACLQSHSHPLQCKALELCFNVALNRLPASTSNPLLSSSHHHHLHVQQQQQYPSISNALVAAFKRAQAHQRRGSIENQQQPLLAVKIELEQLIISILDDPSVSRVMREAGFSSTQVKSNVEQAVSLEICNNNNNNNNNNSPSLTSKPPNKDHQTQAKPIVLDPIRNDDVMSVIDELTKRRNFVIVGESISSIQSLVIEVIEKIHRGEVHEGLRDVKVITLPLAFTTYTHGRCVSRLEIEQKLEEIKGVVKSYMSSSNGVVLNLGDIKWVVESRSSSTHEELGISRGFDNYCPMEHIIMELGELGRGIGESSSHEYCHRKFWLMGFATSQNYIKCKLGNPSLETIWSLHSLTIPADSLRLTLVTDASDLRSQSTSSKKAENGSSGWRLMYEESSREENKQQLTCCADCASKFENEARSLQSKAITSSCQYSAAASSSKLPPWLQQVKNESNGVLLGNNDQESCVTIKDLCRKWNSICSSNSHQQSPIFPEKTLMTFTSLSPSSSTSSFSCRKQHYPINLLQDWPITEFEHKHPFNNHQIDPINFTMYNNTSPILSNPSTAPNSTSSSDVMEMDYYPQKFKELTAENLKTLCNALEYKVPWQKHIIPEIASTILQCRSGMMTRKNKNNKRVYKSPQAKEETWLLFQGLDTDAKEKISKELARAVFGSYNSFVSIALISSFKSSTSRADSMEDLRSNNKRSRVDEQSCGYLERFVEAVSSNPHRVFLIEDVDQVHCCSQIGFKRAIETGSVRNSSGEEVSLSDAIIILSCENQSNFVRTSKSRGCSPPVKQKIEGSCEEEIKKINVAINIGNETQQDNTSTSCQCLSNLDLNTTFEDDSVLQDQNLQSIDDIGLLESVDRRIVFKIQDL